jgi:hypothetical protein
MNKRKTQPHNFFLFPIFICSSVVSSCGRAEKKKIEPGGVSSSLYVCDWGFSVRTFSQMVHPSSRKQNIREIPDNRSGIYSGRNTISYFVLPASSAASSAASSSSSFFVEEENWRPAYQPIPQERETIFSFLFLVCVCFVACV